MKLEHSTVVTSDGKKIVTRSLSEIRLLNLTFCRLSVSESRMLDL